MKNRRKNIREGKKKDNLESDHSDTDERDQKENEELVIRKENQKEGDGYDLVNTDTDQSETDERYQRKHPNLHKTLDSQKIGHDEYSVATDIDMESNVTINKYLNTYTFLARQWTENEYDMVDEEKEMSSDDLTITGDYSDNDILEEEKDTISEKDYAWVSKKKEY